MSDLYNPPPERAGLGSTFKRPIDLLQIGDPNGPGLTIGSPVPTVLTNYYGSGLGIPLAQAYISIINSNGDYYYEVAGVNAGTDVFFGAGVVISGAVRELFRGESGPGLGAPVKTSVSPAGGHVFLGSHSSGSWSALSNNGVLVVGEWLSLFTGCDFNYGGAFGRSLGRGVVSIGTETTSVSGIGTGLTQVMITDTQETYENGRAFRLHAHIPLVNSVAAGDVLAQWLQTNGTVVRPSQTIVRTLAVGSIYTYDESLVFVNTSGADITGQNIRIRVATTGTANLASSVSSSAPGRFEVEDIGEASRFPNAPSMA